MMVAAPGASAGEVSGRLVFCTAATSVATSPSPARGDLPGGAGRDERAEDGPRPRWRAHRRQRPRDRARSLLHAARPPDDVADPCDHPVGPVAGERGGEQALPRRWPAAGVVGSDERDRRPGGRPHRGRRGDDTIAGGSGRDDISAGAGDDFVRASDPDRDVVRCARGRDRVFIARRDRVLGCERITPGWDGRVVYPSALVSRLSSLQLLLLLPPRGE